MNVGELVANLRVNLSQFRTGLKQAQAHVSTSMNAISKTTTKAMNSSAVSTKQAARQMGNSMDNPIDQFKKLDKEAYKATWAVRGYLKDTARVASGIMIAQAFYASMNAIKDAGSALMGFNMQLEEAGISFRILLGSGQAAQGMLQELQDFAATTPFTFSDATKGAQALLASGYAAKDIIPTLRDLVDVVSLRGASSENIDRIMYAMGQIKTAGKLVGQDMRQLTEAGIPAFRILRDELGLTGEEALSIGDQNIDSETGIAALRRGMRKYAAGASEELATTTRGLTNQIKDASLITGQIMFEPIFQTIKDGLGSFQKKIAGLREIGRESGAGGIFEAIVPPGLHGAVRGIIGSLQSLGKSFKRLMIAVTPFVKGIMHSLVQVLGAVLPLLAMMANALTLLLGWATQNTEVVKMLGIAIGTLLIGAAAGKSIALLVVAVKWLAISGPVAIMVKNLGLAIWFLVTKANPVVRVITIIVAAFLLLASRSAYLTAWIDKLRQGLASLGGFDISNILAPEFEDPTDGWLENVDSPFTDAVGGAGELEEGIDGIAEAAKKAFAYIAPFDEVFNIPDQQSSGAGAVADAINIGNLDTGGLDTSGTEAAMPDEIKLPKITLPKIDWPILPPWLTAPINIKFNIKPPSWPKPPPPPTGYATAWIATIVSVINGLKDLQTAGSLVWQGLKMGARVAVGSIGVAWNDGIEGIKLQLQNGLDAIGQFWQDHKRGVLLTVGLIITGVVLWFVGLPALIAGALRLLVPTLRTVFARIGPALLGYAKQLPGIVSTQLGKLPGLASTAIGKVSNAFGGLPGKIGSAIWNIPSKVGYYFNKLPGRATTAVSGIVTAFGKLPGKIASAIWSIPGKISNVLGKIKIPSFRSIGSRIFSSFSRLSSAAGFETGGIIGKDSIVRVGEKGKREAIIPLQNETAMAPFADAVAARLGLQQGGSNNGGDGNKDDRPILYVGTLIADDRSLRDLERRMQVVRMSETSRGVKNA